jgi:protein tyrosine kinase modulator
VTPLVDQVLDELQGVWRHRWLALAVATAVAAVGWTVIFSLPDLYEADAKIFVDSSTALKPILEGLAVEQDVNAELNYVRQSLLAGPQIEKIARKSGVLPDSVIDPERRAAILDQFAHRIVIDVSDASSTGENARSGGTIYEIRYRDRERARSLKVVSTMLRALVDETQGGKQAAAQSAQSFLEQQIQSYGKRLNVAEDRLAAFKSHNLGLLPTQEGGYFVELQKEFTAVSDDETKIQMARARRTVIESQLHGNIAVAAAGSAQPGAGGLGTGADINSQIAQAQEKLDSLELRYTDKHPDVIAQKEILKELKVRRAEQIANLKSGDANAAAITGASSNPVYQSLEQELNRTDLQLADLSTDLAQHRNKAAQLKKLLKTAPQVEAQYEQLTRDYAVNTAQYNALLAKYEKARLGEQAGNAGAVRFSVVQPPIAAYSPVWPRRPLMIVAIWAVALGLGAGLTYLLNQLQPVIYSAAGLTELTGAPLLGVVGAAFPEQALRARRRGRRLFVFAATGFLAAFVVVLLASGAGYRLSSQFGQVVQVLVHT